jgi:hypothetical protein
LLAEHPLPIQSHAGFDLGMPWAYGREKGRRHVIYLNPVLLGIDQAAGPEAGELDSVLPSQHPIAGVLKLILALRAFENGGIRRGAEQVFPQVPAVGIVFEIIDAEPGPVHPGMEIQPTPHIGVELESRDMEQLEIMKLLPPEQP